MEFNKDKTVAIIFDTEWYVPPEDRGPSLTSLKANPAKAEHKYLGGVFTRFFPLKQDTEKDTQEIWVQNLTDAKKNSQLKKLIHFLRTVGNCSRVKIIWILIS